MKEHKCLQKSDEWFNIRRGKITGSRYADLKGTAAKRKKLLYKIAGERITGLRTDSDIASNIHIIRGNEQEDSARLYYEMITGRTVKQIGFVELDKETGCSPDGKISKDGGLEIKCPDIPGFLVVRHTKKIPSKDIPQMELCLYVTGRKWWDYACYNESYDDPIVIIRVIRQEENMEQVAIDIERANKDINEIVQSCKRGAINGTIKNEIQESAK